MNHRDNIIITSIYKSPVGDIILGSAGDTLCLSDWAMGKRRESNNKRVCRYLGAKCRDGNSDIVLAAANQLDEYFGGCRKEFDIPLTFTGTEFQNLVWSKLQSIPYSEVVSYADVASGIGNPKAVRAAASAIASNPLSIFVPCHRVVGSDGRLTGYDGGLIAKEALLKLESNVSEKLGF